MTVRITDSEAPLSSSAWEQLPPDQRRALLVKLLRERQAAAPEEPRPAPREQGEGAELPDLTPDPTRIYEAFPLTDIQYAYWIGRTGLLKLGRVGAHAYVEFELPITDIDRLSRAWQRVVERHDMLRVIIRPDGQQQVQPQVTPYWIHTTDLRAAGPDEVERVLAENREVMSHRVYRPEQWPMFDLRAFLLGPSRTHLCVSADMLILDLKSIQIVFEEWFAYFQNPDAQLEPLNLTFRDYVLAEHALRGSPLYARSRAYWAERIPTLPPPPALPLLMQLDQLKGYRFSRRAATLPADRWRKLRAQVNARRLTPAAALLTAFATTLASWSGARRFSLNLTVFNRLPLHPQVNKLVGDFTGSNLLEVDLQPEEDFAARTQRLLTRLWTDLEHRYVGGVQVIRDLAREQGARWAINPVVFTSYLSQGGSGADTLPPLFPMEVGYGVSQTPQVYLDCQVYERDGGLVVNWDAVDELFPEGMLDAMFDAYLKLLNGLAGDGAGWKEAGFPDLPPAQQAARAAYNDTDAPLSDGLLHTMFEARAAAQPEHPAIVWNHVTLSYGELSQRARQVAHQVLDAGARPGALVAIVMEKGWEQAVAALGILQAGAAYLPIDPEVPAERLTYLLQNGQVEIVLTQTALRSRFEWPEGLRCFTVDDAPLVELPPVRLTRPIQPGDLAYVIYTSGSTGSPKGVMIDHRGAVNTIVDLNARFDVTPADRVLALSALTFDLSVYDLFGVLAAGGTVVLPEHSARRDPQHWLRLMQRERVTLWNSVPALLEMLVEGNADHAELPYLRLVMLSGDWIPLSLARHARSTWPQVRLVSLGGATEASIWSILSEIDEIPEAWKSIPYGRPMLNQSFHVLDEGLNPCPDWVPGELYIGGVGLAMGYWGDAEKSAQRFFVHPRTGERLYRTGDLGRFRADGEIELLGRVDRQVKIRGHRIELGEIEAQLRRDPAVREALVVVRGEAHQARHLAAYVIPTDSAQVSGPSASPSSMLDVSAGADLLKPFTSGDPERDAALKLIERLDERASFKALDRGRRPRGEDHPRVALGDPPAGIAPFAARRSERRFSLEPIPLHRFGPLLASLRVEVAQRRRLYGSAGTLYPIQAYVWVKPGRVEGLGGAYYYDPVSNELERLAGGPLPREAYAPLLHRPMYDEAAFAIFLVSELAAIAPIYGQRSLHFSALEAGLMTQLMEMSAPELGLGLCQIGVLNAEALPGVFQLGPTHELIHSLVGGALDPDRGRSTHAATLADLREDPQVKRMLERVRTLSDAQAAELLHTRGSR